MGLNKHNGQADICKPTEWPCFLYGGGGSRLIFLRGEEVMYLIRVNDTDGHIVRFHGLAGHLVRVMVEW